MTRVLVISGSQSVGEGGLAEGQDVIDDRPPAFEEWLAGGPFDIDALILDLATPIAARLAVDDVRRRSIDVPIVLVAKELPEWNDPQLRSLPDCVVVESPWIRRRCGPPSTVSIRHQTGWHPAPITASPRRFRVTACSCCGNGSPSTEFVGRPNDTAPRRPTPLSMPSLRLGRRMPVRRRRRPLPRFRKEAAFPGRARSRGTAGRRTPGGVPEATGPLPVSAIALVRSLLSRVAELDGVATTTDVIVKSAAERTGADAGVVLLPDGGHWRVAGGIGLRPVEYRFQLGEDSWLVREIAFGSRGLIVEDTDIARSRLRGAPLASWRHLMAAPVSRVGAVLLMARRDDPPFDEAALSALAEVTDEAGPLIAVAMDVRALARALEDFRDRP